MNESNSRPLNDILSTRRFPFLLIMGLFLFLCLKGGLINVFENKLEIPFFYFGPDNTPGIPGGGFILLYFATWLAMIGLFILFPRNIDKRTGMVLILLFGLVCRIALMPHEHSDDVNRYLWEGKLISKNINPYQYPPDHPSLNRLAKADPYHSLINHPENPAAYPPLSLYLFSLAGRISYTPILIKIIMILFDMGAAWFLLFLLSRRGLDLRWGIFYVFNPVILYGFAGQGHFDSIHIFFLAGALYFYDKKSWKWMFLFIGTAVQIKYIAILAFPFLISRDNYKSTWIAGGAMVLPYLPMIDENWQQLFYCIIKFGEEYAFNGSIHGLLRILLGDMGTATAITKLFLGVTLLFGYYFFHPSRIRFKNDPIPGSFFVMGALLIFSPTIHFWYITWIIPFIVLYFQLSWLILTLTIGGYFAVYSFQVHTGQWILPGWIQISEWIPFYILFIFESYRAISRWRSPVDARGLNSLSVIIPTLNEEKQIRQCVLAVKKDRSVSEIWVVDGGSADRTIEIAGEMGAKVIRHLRSIENGGGRGGQIKKGVQKSSGDVIAVVHADIVVNGTEFTKILDILNKNRLLIGGAVGGLFSSKGLGLTLVEYANDFRVAFTGISFGDQIQFFKRSPVILKNLFPDIPLMEDVELSLRLKKLGRLVYLFGSASVSARRWKKMGSDNFFTIMTRFSKYLWRRLWGVTNTTSLYQDYYCNIQKREENEWKPTIHRTICQNLKK